MGNKKNHGRKNKRLANNWRNIIKMRKGKKANVTRKVNSHKLHITDNERSNSTKDVNNIFDDEFSSLTRTVFRTKTIQKALDFDESFSVLEHSTSWKMKEIVENETQSKQSKLQDDCLVKDFTEKQRTRNIENSTQIYYSLQKLDPDQHTRIMRGDFHQSDERFVELSRGKQCVTIAVVALCYSKINNPVTWKTGDINNILIIGDIQYHASYKKMYRDGKCPQKENLLMSEVYPYIKIDRKYFHLNAMDSSEYDVLSLNKLIMSLKRFFHESENECGIFTCNSFSFAVMQRSNSCFLLNPYSTSYAGEPMDPHDQESAACLMEMFTIACLANHLLILCNQGHRILDDSECDAPIIYSLTKPIIENIVFGELVSKRNKVNRDLCTTASRATEFEKHKSSLYGNKADHVNLRNTELPTIRSRTALHSVNSILKQSSVDPTNFKLVLSRNSMYLCVSLSTQ